MSVADSVTLAGDPLTSGSGLMSKVTKKKEKKNDEDYDEDNDYVMMSMIMTISR